MPLASSGNDGDHRESTLTQDTRAILSREVIAQAAARFDPRQGPLRLWLASLAIVYPTLIAAVGDEAHPTWRETAVCVYRLRRGTGYAVGALLGRIVADALDLRAAVWVVAILSIGSGLIAVRMTETHGAHR